MKKFLRIFLWSVGSLLVIFVVFVIGFAYKVKNGVITESNFVEPVQINQK